MTHKPVSRYTAAKGPEVEYEPGSRSRVLRNLRHVTSKREMDRLEFEALVRVQSDYLTKTDKNTSLTVTVIRAMHRDWLGGLYSWAGAYRAVEVSKGGFRWPPCHRIEPNMQEFERTVLRVHTPCLPGALPDVARAITVVHANLLLIHPFRDGNGRLARWLTSLMAAQADLPPPDYRFTGKGSAAQRVRYLEAVSAATWRNMTCSWASSWKP